MFKYIASILKQFTAKQKMSALIVLVITIVVVTLGSTYIKETNKSASELKDQLKAQRQMITYQQSDINKLNKEVRNLNNTILENDMACSTKTLALERTYTEQLIEQQRYVSETVKRVKALLNKSNNLVHRDMLIAPSNPDVKKRDTILALPAPINVVNSERRIPDENLTNAIGLLDNMQRKLKKKN